MSDEIIRTAFDREQRASSAASSWTGKAGTGPTTSATRSPSTTRCAATSACGTSRRSASGTSAAPTRSRRPTASSRTTWPASRSARFATRPSATRTGRWSATARSSSSRTRAAGSITALDSDLDHFNDVVSGMARRDRADHGEAPARPAPGPAVARGARRASTDEEVENLGLLPLLAAPGARRARAVLGLAHRLLGRARLRDLLPTRLCRGALGRLTGAGAKPYGLAAVETLRIESGLIFIGYDYFQHETDPYDMSLDKVIRLDKGDFHGKAALAETAKSPPRRLVTLVVEGARSRSTAPRSRRTASRWGR